VLLFILIVLTQNKNRDIIIHMENQKEFKTQFIEERLRIGWNKKVLSEKTGIPYDTVKNWESGRCVPVDYIQRLVIQDLRGRG